VTRGGFGDHHSGVALRANGSGTAAAVCEQEWAPHSFPGPHSCYKCQTHSPQRPEGDGGGRAGHLLCGRTHFPVLTPPIPPPSPPWHPPPPRVRTTVLGSRSQLCLNEKVTRLPGPAGNFACRALVQHKQCRW
jgi:hypothetical protein